METIEISKKRGRPSVIDETVLKALEMAYKLDCSDQEACSVIGLNPSTLYYFQAKNLWFKELKEEWKRYLVIRVKMTVYKGVLSDPNLALKWLKWRQPHLYS